MFFKEIIDNKNGHIDYYWEDQHGNAREKFVYFRFIKELDWIVVAGTYYDEFYQPLNLILINILITLAIAQIIFIVITYIVLTRSLKPVDKIVTISEDLANGIVNTERINVKTNDEIGKMTNSFNRLVDFLEERNRLMERIGTGDFTIIVKLSSEKDEVGKTLKNMVESLNKTLRNIYQIIEQLSGGAEQISESSQALAGGANEQTASIEEITVSLEEIEYKAKSNFSSLEEAR